LITRRRLLMSAGVGLAGAGVGWMWPEEGLWHPCGPSALPDHIVQNKHFARIWNGIRPERVWDGHVHLVGNGVDGSGCRLNPHMDSWWHPIQKIQKYFYLNSGCVRDGHGLDAAYVERLIRLHTAFPSGSKLMLLAFDWHHDSDGHRNETLSPIYTPNDYARDVARSNPGHFEWIASVHPYRDDAIVELERVARDGARAVKWLPPVQGMDPASPRCDDFYSALARLDLPLLTHAGDELSLHSEAMQDFGNPLRLRRALDRGVRVIIAHCASLGRGVDLDQGEDGSALPNFVLFSRLMKETQYESTLYADIAAIAQIFRSGEPLRDILSHTDWHHRLLYGSDYPLPGVMPVFAPRRLAANGLLADSEARLLSELRQFNPLLFDFALLRLLRNAGGGFANSVFETRGVFQTRR